MTFDRNLLVNLITLPYPLLVRLPNRYRVKITEIGSVCLTFEITLYKVLYAPSIKFNLISINTLADSLKCTVSFSNTSCLMQAPSLKRPLEIGKAHDGLYFLCSDCLQQNNSSHPKQQHVSCISFPSSKIQYKCISSSCPSYCAVMNSMSINNKDNVVDKTSSSFPVNNTDLLWHYRLGHVPFVKMKGISSIPVTFSLTTPEEVEFHHLCTEFLDPRSNAVFQDL